MDINRIAKKIDDTCGNDRDVAQMLKDIFAFQRTAPGWYKAKYKEIIESYSKEVDENAY